MNVTCPFCGVIGPDCPPDCPTTVLPALLVQVKEASTSMLVVVLPRPDNLPMQVFLRLSVKDKAGNLSVAETPKAILVDLVEPEGQLIGVLGANRPSP